jgi:hypothetical protein
LSAVPPFSEGLFAVYVQVMWIVPRFGDRLWLDSALFE